MAWHQCLSESLSEAIPFLWGWLRIELYQMSVMLEMLLLFVLFYTLLPFLRRGIHKFPRLPLRFLPYFRRLGRHFTQNYGDLASCLLYQWCALRISLLYPWDSLRSFFLILGSLTIRLVCSCSCVRRDLPRPCLGPNFSRVHRPSTHYQPSSLDNGCALFSTAWSLSRPNYWARMDASVHILAYNMTIKVLIKCSTFPYIPGWT